MSGIARWAGMMVLSGYGPRSLLIVTRAPAGESLKFKVPGGRRIEAASAVRVGSMWKSCCRADALSQSAIGCHSVRERACSFGHQVCRP